MSDVTPRPLRPSERLRACAAMGGTVTLDQSMIRQLLAEVADMEKARVVPDALRASVMAEAMAEATRILEQGRSAVADCAASLSAARDLKASADARFRQVAAQVDDAARLLALSDRRLRRSRRLGWIATAMIVLTYGGILWRVL